jgi:hypothetical protein
MSPVITNHVGRTTVAFASVALLLCSVALSDARECSGHLTTAYQTVPVVLTVNGQQAETRKINLAIRYLDLAGGRGMLQLDATTCRSVDVFGEVTECTPGVFAPEDVEFVRLRLADPAGRGRRVYLIRGSSSVAERLFLVVPHNACDSHRITIEDSSGAVNRVLTLEHEPLEVVSPRIIYRRRARCTFHFW